MRKRSPTSTRRTAKTGRTRRMVKADPPEVIQVSSPAQSDCGFHARLFSWSLQISMLMMAAACLVALIWPEWGLMVPVSMGAMALLLGAYSLWMGSVRRSAMPFSDMVMPPMMAGALALIMFGNFTFMMTEAEGEYAVMQQRMEKMMAAHPKLEEMQTAMASERAAMDWHGRMRAVMLGAVMLAAALSMLLFMPRRVANLCRCG